MAEIDINPGTASWLADFFEPLVGCDDPDLARSLLLGLGLGDAEAEAAVGLITDFAGLAQQASGLIGGDEATPLESGAAAIRIATAAGRALAQMPTRIEQLASLDPLRREELGRELPRRLFDRLVARLMIRRAPLAAEGLIAVGLMRLRSLPETGAAEADPNVLWRLEWERLSQLLTAPGELVIDAHGGQDFDARSLLGSLVRLAALARLPLGIGYGSDVTTSDPLQQEPGERTIYDIVLAAAADAAHPNTGSRVGFRLTTVPSDPPRGMKSGITLMPYARGNTQIGGEPIPGWAFAFDANAELLTGAFGVDWRPPYGVRFQGRTPGGLPITPAGAVAISLRSGEATGQPVVVAGNPGKTRVSYKTVKIGLSASIDNSELIASLACGGLDFVIVPDDPFLRKVLPPDGLVVDCSTALEISSKHGVGFRGGAGLDVTLQINETVADVLRLDSVRITGGVRDYGIAASTGVLFAVLIGDDREVTLTVKGLGLAAGLTPRLQTNSGNLGPLDAYVRMRAPDGVGIAVKAKIVEGGGFLSFDYVRQLYTGAVQLQVKEPSLGLGAIGMLNTRMPDGTDGFSLLAIIDGSFPPIQLGGGFTLNAVGGLIGIHRGVDTAVLAAGLRTGALESVMFPRDPVANAPTLLAALTRVFPATDGRFVVGPMAKIAWGIDKVELSLALILDLPAPIRLLILGRMDVRMPRNNPTIVLQLDILGVIDFDRREATLDAALVNSRISTFPITGGMAARFSWGERHEFLLAIGGFNPRFAIPPGFRTPDRLAIVLVERSDMRFRIQAYIALTSNSVQIGARADFMYRVATALGTFGITAYLGFDALIQFSPFLFECDVAASIAISLNDTPLLLARLEADLTGPGEWHLAGVVELQIIVKVRLAFDQRFGRADEAIEELVDVRELLLAEIEKPENWVALPVGGSSSGFVCKAVPDNRPSPMHPIGEVALRERVVPLRKEIRRFGSARPTHGPETYRLTSIAVGALPSTTFYDVFDEFAPGQFDDLTDDERLSRPSFEAMPAGGRFETTALQRLPAATHGNEPGLTVGLVQFDDTIIDKPNVPGSLPAKTLGAPVGELLFLFTDPAAPVRPRPLVAIVPERYVVADARTLMANSGTLGGVSHAEASDLRRRLSSSVETVVAFEDEAA